MRLSIQTMLACGQIVLAAEWIIDSTSCNQWHTGVKKMVKQGLEIADTALKAMTDHPDDEHVQIMAKCVLGETDFQTKFDKVIETLQKIGGFSREPFDAPGPRDPQWEQYRSNVDLEIYCDSSRFERVTVKGKARYKEPAQGGRVLSARDSFIIRECEKLKPDESIDLIHAITVSSDIVDKEKRKAARERGEEVGPHDYVVPTEFANTMQLCRRIIEDEGVIANWPDMDIARVQNAMEEDFIEKARAKDAPPIDMIMTMGTTILHEMAHTNQGGKLIDVRTSSGEGAYGWWNCAQVQNPLNAESVMTLAVALKVWSLGNYYVNNDGFIVVNNDVD